MANNPLLLVVALVVVVVVGMFFLIQPSETPAPVTESKASGTLTGTVVAP